ARTIDESAAGRSSGTSAFSATSSGIHVFPSWHRSGVTSPANAVSSFSWAAVHGSCCTLTRMPGWVRSNSESSSATTSPSRPIAQNGSTGPREAEDRQPDASHTAATPARAAARNRAVRDLLTGSGEPATREAGLLEAPAQVRILAHDAPDQGAPVVL